MFTGNSSCTHKCYTDNKAAVEKETGQQRKEMRQQLLKKFE